MKRYEDQLHDNNILWAFHGKAYVRRQSTDLYLVEVSEADQILCDVKWKILPVIINT